jgi:hypothetical protein
LQSIDRNIDRILKNLRKEWPVEGRRSAMPKNALLKELGYTN